MQLYSTVTPYVLPLTMGDQSTAAQNVYWQTSTTAQETVVPVRVVSLQCDLDRLQEQGLMVERELSLADFPSLVQLSTLIRKEPQPEQEEEGEVVVHTGRVLTAERASHEWQQMTEPAGPSVQLPSDIED